MDAHTKIQVRTPIQYSSLDSLSASPPHRDSAVNADPRKSNATSASDLPPELLGHIFLHHLALHDRTPQPNAWMRLALVCKYWRDLCLQLPDLWTRMVVVRLECVEEMLRRSGDQPLMVRVGTFETSEDRRRATLEALMRHSPRIREWELRGPWHRHEAFATFPLGVRPVYDRLTVRGYPFKWTDAFFASSVRHLVMQGCSDLACSPSAAPDMLDALARMSFLETLTLENSLPMASSQWGVGNGGVALPELRSLSITDSGHSCAVLLDHLLLPSSTQISIRCTRCRDAELVHIATALASKFSGQPTAQPLLSFSTGKGASSSTLRMIGWKTAPDANQMEVDDKLPGSWDLELVLHDVRVARPAMDTAFHLLLPAVQSMSLDVGVLERCFEGTSRYRGWAPGLRTLSLTNWNPDSFQELLLHDFPESGPMKCTCPFPHLQTLNLDKPSRKPSANAMERDIKTSMALRDVLSRRCAFVGKLHTLAIHPEAAVRPVRWMLEKYVTRVD